MTNFSDDILHLIDQLAVRLQKPVAAVWEIAYRQVIVDGITSAMVAVFCLLYCAATFYIYRRKPELFIEDRNIGLTLIGFLVLVTCVFAVLMFCVSSVEAVQRFINPSYFAIIHLREMLK